MSTTTATDNLAKLRDMFREGTTPRKLAEDALAALEARTEPEPLPEWVNGPGAPQDAPTGNVGALQADPDPVADAIIEQYAAKRKAKR